MTTSKHLFLFGSALALTLAAVTGVACGDAGGSGGAGGDDEDEDTSSTTDDGSTSETTGETTSTGMILPECEAVTQTVSFTNDVAPIFQTKCATSGCHTGSLPDGGMNLGADNAYEATVNHATKSCSGDRVRIIPGDPAESYLWDKIQNTDLCGTSGKMPPSGKPQLTAEQKTVITAWICGGAVQD
ncbi:MAG: hypothetical protein HOV80_07575 [Polyangiaceae bacterium]|nr:hypothetical protein [Polyangiaceae bacterium]